MTGGHRARVERLGGVDVADERALGQVAATGHARQRRPPLGVGRVDQRAAVQHQAVEEVQRERHLPHERVHPVHAPETPHQLLERQWPAGGVERDDLAVQDERGAGQLPRDRDDVGQAARHVGEPARPDPHPLALAMDLHAGAIVLELERGPAAVGAQHVTEVGRDLGQHGQQRHERPRRRAAQRRRAARAGQRRHRREVAEEERGPAHRGHVGVGGQRDRLQHEAMGDAGAQLAADDAIEKIALVRRGPPRQLGQPRVPRPPRAGAGGRRDVRERLADVGQRERRSAAGRHAARQPAHAEHARIGARKRAPDEKRDGEPDLVGLDRP